MRENHLLDQRVGLLVAERLADAQLLDDFIRGTAYYIGGRGFTQAGAASNC